MVYSHEWYLEKRKDPVWCERQRIASRNRMQQRRKTPEGCEQVNAYNRMYWAKNRDKYYEKNRRKMEWNVRADRGY